MSLSRIFDISTTWFIDLPTFRKIVYRNIVFFRNFLQASIILVSWS